MCHSCVILLCHCNEEQFHYFNFILCHFIVIKYDKMNTPFFTLKASEATARSPRRQGPRPADSEKGPLKGSQHFLVGEWVHYIYPRGGQIFAGAQTEHVKGTKNICPKKVHKNGPKIFLVDKGITTFLGGLGPKKNCA